MCPLFSSSIKHLYYTSNAKLIRFFTYRFVQEGFLQELQRLLVMQSPSRTPRVAPADDPVPNALNIAAVLLAILWVLNFWRALTRA